jgi:hypothetical protein
VALTIAPFAAPLTDDESTACHAVVPRQFSVWPFGMRNARLLLSIDPSRADADLSRALLRAMQHTCFRSESGSHVSAVRSSVLAAHYVLQHRNHDALQHNHVTAAASAVVRRGNMAYAAMAGDAAVLVWRSGRLSGQRGPNRSGRPLGMEAEPRVTLWSTPIRPGDRLIAVTGAVWHDNTPQLVADVLADSPAELAEERLVGVLSSNQGRVRVLIDDGTAPARPVEDTRRRAAPPAPVSDDNGPRRRWLLPMLPVAVLVVGAAIVLSPGASPQHETLRNEAETLLAQAEQAPDLYQAHSLVVRGRSLAERAADLVPAEHAPLLQRATELLESVDRIARVQPTQVVRLGPTGANVVDLAVSVDRLFTLDVVEGAVRGFDPLGSEQVPTPETLLVRKGAALGRSALDTPIAIQYVGADRPEAGALTIVDRARTIAILRSDGVLTARPLPSSALWQRLSALGSDLDGNLYVLDSGQRALLEYRASSQGLLDPPNALLATPPFGLDAAAEVLPLRELYVRLVDGGVRRVSREGELLDFAPRPPDGLLGPVTAIAPDRLGGLFLADPSHARVVQVTAEGAFVRQLRDPALAGIRQLQSSPDGRRLFGLVASGVLGFELPE